MLFHLIIRRNAKCFKEYGLTNEIRFMEMNEKLFPQVYKWFISIKNSSRNGKALKKLLTKEDKTYIFEIFSEMKKLFLLEVY